MLTSEEVMSPKIEMNPKQKPSYYVNIHWSNSRETWKRINKNKKKIIQQPKKKRKDIGMKKLSEREDIIITKADKGGAIVIVGVKDYIKETEWQLNNTKNYRKLQEDPTTTNMKLVNDTIERIKNQKLINQKVAESLKRNDPKTPKFYL